MDQTLLQVFVYLAAAVIAAPLAQRAGLGSVLGYLIAGALIGPWALNLVGETERVAHTAEFGVVILLFLIGLEVQPGLLWRMRGQIVGVGASQVAVSGAALAAAGLALGLDWRQAVAVGLILAMSSTAIVLQMLDEKGLRRAAVGRSAFGVLLFQDLAVIPLLAVLPLLAMAHPTGTPAAAEAHSLALMDGQPLWLRTLAMMGAVIAVVAGGRYLTPPVFRLIARTRLREMFTAAALALVVGVALLMQTVGLSPALGAFLAGVVLAESEFRREIETDIEPFRGLLLGIFFITVGAGLNFGLIAAKPWLTAGLVIGLMGIKALVMLVIARTSKLAWRDAGMTAVALSQGGEFCFVLLTYAVSVRVLPTDLAAVVTGAVALSMAATPLLVAAYERLARTRASAAAGPENDFDDRDPDVVIAGFGRFGQIVGRLLTVNGFTTSVLENSVEQIALLRRFGRPVYYGDAARLDLLRAAGAGRAKALVVAVDDKEKAAEIVSAAREAWPDLPILARAFDRRDVYELMNRGAHIVERETFEGGLAMGMETLRALGWRAYRAERAARYFRRHDERMIEELRKSWGDEQRYAVAVRESSPRMEDLLKSDLSRMGPEVVDSGWDVESLYAEAQKETGAAGKATPDPV
ncbi:MAG: monovalent cation:proton antiporter-2 (CPA2) family protein [Caulobacteraceae bacterium]